LLSSFFFDDANAKLPPVTNATADNDDNTSVNTRNTKIILLPCCCCPCFILEIYLPYANLLDTFVECCPSENLVHILVVMVQVAAVVEAVLEVYL
jgi:hypothetical protein